MAVFNAVVIGSGQAGNPLAHRLADRGWSVALIEREHFGGSCINYGCTPTKAMLASARAAHVARSAGALGVRVGSVDVDLAAVVARKDQLVQQWRRGQEGHAAKRPTITVFRGAARFAGPRTIAVTDQAIEGEHVFINTGTSPLIPSIPGLAGAPYFTNRDIMTLTEVPAHLVIIGASYIGLEFGQMFRRFGSRVTIVEMGTQIVPREDADVAAALQAALETEGIEFLLDAEVTRVRAQAPGVGLTVRRRGTDDQRDIGASHLLVAAGREPNTRGLGLDSAGVNTHRGWITVNDQLETNVPGVYALGDVTGGPAFTHISYNDFQIVFHNLFNEAKLSTAGRLVPYALFTDPELGRVGMTEREARASGRPVLAGSIPMSRVARAIESGETAGLMKVVVDAETERILGAAILGTAGGELAQTLMALMMAGASWKLFYRSVYIHPTLTEGFFALMDSVK